MVLSVPLASTDGTAAFERRIERLVQLWAETGQESIRMIVIVEMRKTQPSDLTRWQIFSSYSLELHELADIVACSVPLCGSKSPHPPICKTTSPIQLQEKIRRRKTRLIQGSGRG